ncbi:MAG: 2-methylthioadenine synthetase [Candidatus Roizmanbacteria bacterium GW2011_GWC2_37_13]|uniref:2-methylthioadenine synthetase n=1 Tax=Candidatus Roizmanbacteria bacterium GW2011_GWC2_37_13 TaxID=1618486 RepID=A0A0G0GHZ6_9BACT|nr:MAG: 2-methylthioadenine synthetase [Candidatus Roizmanbacteria bacterium GW2011_GWC1_37_12]KKQ25720.1 MAG: 2-methylthioadenine synthetase [Candidatus Roizmanbacteria bacterium GW2011_GWC2_37_13]
MSFFSYSFGCRVNEAEKEEIDCKMSLNGFRFDKNKPDIFIINSCSVTNKAEREARQLIYQTKKKLPEAKIVVTGCSATYWLKNNLYKDLPIDIIIDNVNKEYLVDLIKKRLNIENLASFHLGGGSGNFQNQNKFIDSGRLMVKIQDGCQRYCSFCIVPYLRGMPKSERIKSILSRISSYAKASEDKKNLGREVKEVIFTAINTEAFGYDTGETLIQLIQQTLTDSTVPRISFGSIHPWSINNEFINYYKNILPLKRLVNFFHVPIQSGSNKILNLMKRGYTREEMMEKLHKLHKINPLALIATDVIVGFLDETDKDFQDTYNFLKESPIDKFHVFRFSKRTKTAADYMEKRLNEPSVAEKTKRAAALIKLGKKKYFQFKQKNINRVSLTLFLQRSEEGFREALLDNQLPIWIADKGRSATSEVAETGKIKNVKIIEFKKGRLFGKIV